ncbi:MAG TPA: flagellar biosynthesis protein FlhF [Anaeromyxobacteraceae bacterium]|nr:flagellar biosynthesis protein FlhF [Anaeromyxobacteraceae bacterium]
MSATVRTFRAPDSASALAAVKAALGPEAILISSRTVQGSLFRRAEVEVTAAAGPLVEQAPGELRAAVAAYKKSDREPRDSLRAGRPADDQLASEVKLLRRSVEEARRALATVTREAQASHDLQIPPAAAMVHARLIGRGVEPVLAEELVRQALQLAARASGLAATVRDLVSERLLPCRAPWLHEGRHAIALVGPTGVGKTTTLAKIAARALIEAKKRVALLTVDTYRIGACDQLARYGEIMGAPVLVARDRSELVAAYERVRDADLVLVDTAGRSSAEDVARQADLVRAIPKIQLHLVVSAATGALELAAVGERYRALQPDRLLFSKLDEAAGPGGVLSIAVRIPRPVSCITDGQRVPEDLHALSAAELADLVLEDEPPTQA